MGNWYITAYTPDLVRETPRLDEVKINPPAGGPDVRITDEDLGSFLVEVGICHMGRTTSASYDRMTVTHAQIIHLEDGRWLYVTRGAFVEVALSEDALWLSACQKARWDPEQRRHVL